MKSFGKYISKHLASFAAFILVLVLLNALAFGITFQSVIINDYGDTSPQNMLEEISAASTIEGVRTMLVKNWRALIFGPCS